MEIDASKLWEKILKIIKKRINVDSITGTSGTAVEDENVAVEVVEEGTQATPDIIEKVNFYLRNNPEKRQKLERRYRAVVGQE